MEADRLATWWKGSRKYALLQAIAGFALSMTRQIIGDALATVAGEQRRNGTFGTPCRTERVVAVLLAVKKMAATKNRPAR